MYTVLQNVIWSTTSNTIMYLTIKHKHLHYYIWLQIHKSITLPMNLHSGIIIIHGYRCTSTLYHP